MKLRLLTSLILVTALFGGVLGVKNAYATTLVETTHTYSINATSSVVTCSSCSVFGYILYKDGITETLGDSSSYTAVGSGVLDLNGHAINNQFGTSSNRMYLVTNGYSDVYAFAYLDSLGWIKWQYAKIQTPILTLITPIDTFAFESNPIYFSGKIANGQNYDKLDFYIFSNTLGIQLDFASTTFVLPNYITNWTREIWLPYIGQYTSKVRLVNSATGSSTDWSNSKTFSLSTTTTTIINTNVSTSTLVFIPNEVCGALDFGCDLKNGLLWILQPSTDSVSQLVGYKSQIENKPPFGYITLLTTQLGNLSTTSTSTFSIIIPTYLATYIFTPIKIALGALLWFVALVWLYNRLKHLQL